MSLLSTRRISGVLSLVMAWMLCVPSLELLQAHETQQTPQQVKVLPNTPDIFEKTAKYLKGIEAEMQAERARLLTELVGKEYTEGKKHTNESLEVWFTQYNGLFGFVSLAQVSESVREQELDRQAFEKGRLGLEQAYSNSFERVRKAAVAAWCLYLREGGLTGDGQVSVLRYMSYTRSFKQEKDYNNALKALGERFSKSGGENNPAYKQELGRLRQEFAKADEDFYKKLGAEYQKIFNRLVAARRRLAGDLWQWHDYASTKSAARDDFQARQADVFRKRIYRSFQPDGIILDIAVSTPGSGDRLKVFTPYWEIPAVNFPDIEVAPGAGIGFFRLTNVGREHADSLRTAAAVNRKAPGITTTSGSAPGANERENP